MPEQTHPHIVLVLLRILCNPSAHHSVVAAPYFISQVATILLILGPSCSASSFCILILAHVCERALRLESISCAHEIFRLYFLPVSW